MSHGREDTRIPKDRLEQLPDTQIQSNHEGLQQRSQDYREIQNLNTGMQHEFYSPDPIQERQHEPVMSSREQPQNTSPEESPSSSQFNLSQSVLESDITIPKRVITVQRYGDGDQQSNYPLQGQAFATGTLSPQQINTRTDIPVGLVVPEAHQQRHSQPLERSIGLSGDIPQADTRQHRPQSLPQSVVPQSAQSHDVQQEHIYGNNPVTQDHIHPGQVDVTQDRGHVQQSQGIVQQNNGPVQQIQGPVQQSQDRVQQSQGPVQQSQGPFQQSQGIVQQSQGPVQQSQSIIQQSQGPFQQTQDRIQQSQDHTQQCHNQSNIQQFQIQNRVIQNQQEVEQRAPVATSQGSHQHGLRHRSPTYPTGNSHIQQNREQIHNISAVPPSQGPIQHSHVLNSPLPSQSQIQQNQVDRSPSLPNVQGYGQQGQVYTSPSLPNVQSHIQEGGIPNLSLPTGQTATPEWVQHINQMMALQFQQNQQLTMAIQQMATQFAAMAASRFPGANFVPPASVLDNSSGIGTSAIGTETRSTGVSSAGENADESQDDVHGIRGNLSIQVSDPRIASRPTQKEEPLIEAGPYNSPLTVPTTAGHHTNIPASATYPFQQSGTSEGAPAGNLARDSSLQERIDKYFRGMKPPTHIEPFEDDESVSSMRTSTTGSGQSRRRNKKKNELIHDAHKIHQKLRDGVVGKRLNILLIGLPGVGKSSLVNSMVMALNNNGYKEISVRGSYGAGGRDGRSAVTLVIKGSPLFSPVLFKDSPELKYDCQPTFFDCPGLPDTDDKNISGIIRLILDGRMKERSNITDLLRVNEKELKRKFSKTDKNKEMDVVLVVHAATDPLPEALLSSIRDAIAPEETGVRGVPMLAVITKTDQVSNPSELEDIENSLAGELGMTGAKERIFCTKLYCNEVTPGLKRDEEIDTNMCRIWEYILRPELINNKPKPGRIGSLLKR